MVKKIDALTAEQEAQMDAWADKWIEIGLRTGDADRQKFERAAEKCYSAAGIPWHGNVVWVPSPIVMAFAAPTADFVLQKIGGNTVSGAVRGAVGDAVGDAVRDAVRGAVGDAVGGAVGGAVSVAVRGAVGDAVSGAVRGAVGDAVGDAVRDAVRGAVGDAVGGAVGGAVRDAVGDAVGGAVRGAVSGAVSGAVGGAVGGAVSVAVRGAVGDAVGGAVRGAVSGAVSGAVGGAVGGVLQHIGQNWYRYIGGQFWSGGYWWSAAFTSFFREICNLELDVNLWNQGIAYEETVESACWWYPHADFLMVCERPTAIHRELTNPDVTRGWGSHRLHCDDGPAVAFRDGWGVYAIHGVQVPAYVVLEPEKITWQAIDAETNAEVRRVMIDRYGPERYVVDSGASVVAALPENHPMQGLRSARLLVKSVPNDEPIVYVDLLNSTPEPDGSVKRYMLRVDPNAYGGDAAMNVHAAAASTWRNADGSMAYSRWKDYAPVSES